MQPVFNPLVAMYQTQLETSRRLVDAVFSGTEKIDRVMIGAAHRALNEQLNRAEELAAMRVPALPAPAARFGSLSSNSGSMINDQKEIMRIFVDMQTEISRSLQEGMGKVGTLTPAAGPAQVSDTRRQMDDARFNPVAGMLSVWESAFKEVTDLVRKNMTAARAAGENIASDMGQSAQATGHAMTTVIEQGAESASRQTEDAGEPRRHSSHPSQSSHSSSGGGKKKHEKQEKQ